MRVCVRVPVCVSVCPGRWNLLNETSSDLTNFKQIIYNTQRHRRHAHANIAREARTDTVHSRGTKNGTGRTGHTVGGTGSGGGGVGGGRTTRRSRRRESQEEWS